MADRGTSALNAQCRKASAIRCRSWSAVRELGVDDKNVMLATGEQWQPASQQASAKIGEMGKKEGSLIRCCCQSGENKRGLILQPIRKLRSPFGEQLPPSKKWRAI
jgi:hypothetical protein